MPGDQSVLVNGQHLPLDYRLVDETRHHVPAEVCDTCSNLEMGELVAVSSCPKAKVRSDEMYEYLQGGPRPEWMGPEAFNE
jgi:hypothetical protein